MGTSRYGDPYRCIEHDTVQTVGEQCAGIAKGSCRSCGCWIGEHYAARTFSGDPVVGCSGTEFGGDYGEYNVPCGCLGFEGDKTASVVMCTHED